MTKATLIVIAKEPRPGAVKTRLCPPCTSIEAATLAEAALRDTLGVVERVDAARRVLALDGAQPDWTPSTFEVIAQRGAGLDERLANAFRDATGRVGDGVADSGPMLLVGMDTPHMPEAELCAALSALERPGTDAVLGPARDGGYWLVGFARPVDFEAAFFGVPMSVPETYRAQRARLESHGLRVTDLATLSDIDYFNDAQSAALLAPDRAFAHVVYAIDQRVARHHTMVEAR